MAKEDDLVVGTGTSGNGMRGRLVFAMRVTGKIDFADYWNDPRFRRKRPIIGKSRILSYGDNIYAPGATGYSQLHSHHSLPGGSENTYNKDKDTGTDHVLISDDFIYFGANAVQIPAYLRDFDGVDLCAPTQGHISSKIGPEMAAAVRDYFESFGKPRIRGRPAKWGFGIGSY